MMLRCLDLNVAHGGEDAIDRKVTFKWNGGGPGLSLIRGSRLADVVRDVPTGVDSYGS